MAYLAKKLEPTLPPPLMSIGVSGWLRHNLFSSPFNTLLSLVMLYVIYNILSAGFRWGILDAVWTGTSAKDCPNTEAACWAFISARFNQIIYGGYPLVEQWRVDIFYAPSAAGVFALLMPKFPAKSWIGLFMLTGFPVIAVILLVGGLFGLPVVGTNNWGGLLITLVVSATTIAVSIPVGLLLALGRRSRMPAIRIICTAFIEFWRGVPLIAVLFMASALFPLFTPEGVSFDKLLRALLAFSLSASGYMAEVFRGGLQAVPKGQFEAARSVGIGYWKMMGYVILPQALRNIIPALMNTCISIFKETSLVLVIGLSDLLEVIHEGREATNWLGGSNMYTSGYVFAAFAYWLFTFSASRYSVHLEHGPARPGG